MTKQQFSLRNFVINVLTASAFILGLVLMNSTSNGTKVQSHLYDNFDVRLQIKNEIAEEINNEKALQSNGLSNDINQFMIYEFKNIYRVKA